MAPHYEINHDARPTHSLPAIRLNEDGSGKEVALLKWGLIPGWAKDAKIASHLINARGETVDRLPSFRAAFKRRRALIPASAWYEWPIVAGKKVKHRVTIGDAEPFSLAGLWEVWRPEPDAQAIQTFTIITTAAPAGMEWVHNRAPCVIALEHYDFWLDPRTETAKALLYPFEGRWQAVPA
jgi:putative SOS response-associated peptidase YedK